MRNEVGIGALNTHPSQKWVVIKKLVRCRALRGLWHGEFGSPRTCASDHLYLTTVILPVPKIRVIILLRKLNGINFVRNLMDSGHDSDVPERDVVSSPPHEEVPSGRRLIDIRSVGKAFDRNVCSAAQVRDRAHLPNLLSDRDRAQVAPFRHAKVPARELNALPLDS
jgi:hypothetical protein